MNRNYFTIKEPPTSLYEKIISTLQVRERRRKTRRLAASASIGFLSLFALVPAALWLARDLSASGFIQMFSLAFSDGGTVLAYWQQFSFSLLESLPFVSLVTCLISLFVAILSLRIFIVSKRSHGHSLRLN